MQAQTLQFLLGLFPREYFDLNVIDATKYEGNIETQAKEAEDLSSKVTHTESHLNPAELFPCKVTNYKYDTPERRDNTVTACQN
eukprot:CAMPEP_0184036666 /NCGR_PEP_ID=MMETSP0955-20130417/33844_1 /TAXON_ID=627963 /ORGANISM="Aplanochytrium sp, Strain PBS07" /LENGTH=83 /DNA_ID=CAMNT_0026324391 /DNA_START=41 /DNA_END=289 /DNA_ORIENTATION=+